jgi:hypothetical protein
MYRSGMPTKHAIGVFKGTVASDFYMFWLEWIYLGLDMNRFWFFSFSEIPLILNNQIKY